MLLDEHTIVIERLNHEAVTRDTMLQSAISSVFSSAGAKAFNRSIGEMSFEAIAHHRAGDNGDGEEGR